MSADRDVRDVVVAGWEGRLKREGVRNAHTVALELAVIAEAHGVRLARPAHLHDPNANWQNKPEPGDHGTGALAALAAIGKGVCTVCGDRVDLTGDLIGPHDVSDNPPHPPFHPCLGAGKPPRQQPVNEDQEQPDE